MINMEGCELFDMLIYYSDFVPFTMDDEEYLIDEEIKMYDIFEDDKIYTIKECTEDFVICYGGMIIYYDELLSSFEFVDKKNKKKSKICGKYIKFNKK